VTDSANVELVRRTFDAMHRGEHQNAARAFHDDAVWQNTREFPGPRCCRGPQAIVDFWTTLVEDFDGTQEVERIIHDGNTVVIGMHTVGRARTSGIPSDVRWAAIVKLRDDRIGRVDVHGSLSKALAVAGMED
jgi:ketosteroid isomerase-like protein